MGKTGHSEVSSPQTAKRPFTGPSFGTLGTQSTTRGNTSPWMDTWIRNLLDNNCPLPELTLHWDGLRQPETHRGQDPGQPAPQPGGQSPPLPRAQGPHIHWSLVSIPTAAPSIASRRQHRELTHEIGLIIRRWKRSLASIPCSNRHLWGPYHVPVLSWQLLPEASNDSVVKCPCAAPHSPTRCHPWGMASDYGRVSQAEDRGCPRWSEA